MENYIIIGQYYGISLISTLIKWRTWSDVSHTAAISQDLEYVYEAWRHGVTKSKWSEQPHTKGTKVKMYIVSCNEVQAKMFYNYLESKIGTKYDFKGIIGFILRLPTARRIFMY